MRRLPQLDAARGLAIIMVLALHYFYAPISESAPSLLILLAKSCRAFTSGVDLFFVLSAFLLTRILRPVRQTPDYYRVFYLRRSCRILPLYVMLLLAYSVVKSTFSPPAAVYATLFAGDAPLLAYWTFTQNVVLGVHGNGLGGDFLMVSWSLAVEEQFYLLLPFLVRRLSMRHLAALSVLIIFAAALLRGFLPGFAAMVLTPCRLDAFMLGVLAALCLESDNCRQQIKEYLPWVYGIFSLLAAGMICMTVRTKPFGSMAYSWYALLFALSIVLIVADDRGWLRRLIDHGPLRFLGRISFGIYLFHVPVLTFLHAAIYKAPPSLASWSQAGVSGLALIITVSLAEFSFRFFESPIFRWSHQYSYRPQT